MVYAAPKIAPGHERSIAGRSFAILREKNDLQKLKPLGRLRFTSRMTPSIRQLEVAVAEHEEVAAGQAIVLDVPVTAGSAAATSTAPLNLSRGVFKVAAGHWPEYLMEALGLGLFMF